MNKTNLIKANITNMNEFNLFIPILPKKKKPKQKKTFKLHALYVTRNVGISTATGMCRVLRQRLKYIMCPCIYAFCLSLAFIVKRGKKKCVKTSCSCWAFYVTFYGYRNVPCTAESAIIYCVSIGLLLTLLLLNTACPVLANSVDPDQLT